MPDLDSIFAEKGPLSRVISGFRPRASQLEMARTIAAAIASGDHFIAEAGTGTGKTFAYLVPAILSQRRTILSTGTRNLQDQLFTKDIPLIRASLSVSFQAALLKGRSNYLCRYRLSNTLESGLGFSREDSKALNLIRRWAGKTRSGDVAEVASVPENSPLWYLVTSTADNCLGQDCPEYQECFLVKSRRKAQDAEILVVNHHLLCADWALRDDGFGELLPKAEVIIVDEAHQLYDTASRFLGLSVSARQINDLSRDVVTEHLQGAPDMPRLRSAAEELEQSVLDARLAFGEAARRGAWREIAGKPDISRGLNRVLARLRSLKDVLEPASERTKGLESCWRRCAEVETNLKKLLEENGSDWIRWFETHKRTFTLNRTPFEIAHEFEHLMSERRATWIFTSATLTVSKHFDHFKSALGLKHARDAVWDSPFDFSSQALFYHPRNLPDPASPQYVSAVVETAIPVLKASKGRAFFLFTSHRALREAAEILEPRIEYPLLVQGSQPKAILIEQFKTAGNSVLLGTASFWEGVDVRGDALSCVIIDKLPFASPGDPVMQARLDNLRRRGENPFESFQLPMAVIALKQGVGRLIRDVDDRGVFVLCDPRLLKRSYGRVFLDSLPPMRRTRSIEDVESFFKAIPQPGPG
ncbi:MAG: ATP-dependent DNA helicase [Methylococcaceae bacterium]|nr:ATP-dependent DNA helicase [Methylococcaceae bacterium]MCI0733708.1 ATP-dependent DNA helicase [Methylococcaceae bacterium]